MKFRRALIAGVLGALVAISLSVLAIWLLRFDANARLTLRRAAVSALPWAAWIPLAIAAVVGGAVLAIAYAFIFEFVTRHAGALIGAALGLAEAAAVWLGVGLALQYVPGVAELFAQEASLLFGDVRAMAAFALAHVAYGAIVGRIYGSPVHQADVLTRVTWREVAGTAAAEGEAVPNE